MSPGPPSSIPRLRSNGIKGVGQSSWGPTVFAVVGERDAASVVAFARRHAVARLATMTVTRTVPTNQNSGGKSQLAFPPA